MYFLSIYQSLLFFLLSEKSCYFTIFYSMPFYCFLICNLAFCAGNQPTGIQHDSDPSLAVCRVCKILLKTRLREGCYILSSVHNLSVPLDIYTYIYICVAHALIEVCRTNNNRHPAEISTYLLNLLRCLSPGRWRRKAGNTKWSSRWGTVSGRLGNVAPKGNGGFQKRAEN